MAVDKCGYSLLKTLLRDPALGGLVCKKRACSIDYRTLAGLSNGLLRSSCAWLAPSTHFTGCFWAVVLGEGGLFVL